MILVFKKSDYFADSFSKSVPDLCSALQVSLQFSPPKAVPGEKSSLQLSAQPGSLCGLSAVDQSALILEPGKRLDAQKVTIATFQINSDIINFTQWTESVCVCGQSL